MEDDAAAESMNVFMVGIKGAGMSSLAVLLHSKGFAVSGSDSPEYFITQDNLAAHGIIWRESWDPCHIPSQCSLIIHSSAYDPQSHPQICEARKKSIPVYTYSAYIGRLSEESACSCCVSGTHGKTTTSAFIEQLLIALDIPAFAVYGSYSSAAAADSASTRFPLSGNPFEPMAGIIEACEYNRHFLQLRPDVLVVTNIDYDHPDTYRDMQETQKTFAQLAGQISEYGYLVYCADDLPSALTAAELTASRPDIHLIPYGETAKGSFSVRFLPDKETGTIFQLGCSPEPICLPVPGRHIALDAAGAAAAAASVLALSYEKDFSGRVYSQDSTAWERLFLKVSSQSAEACTRIYPQFRGLHRRSEILGTAGGVLVMDDYAHHPTEIQAMLVGLKRYYPDKRIIVDFMAHTFSRTRALFTRFSQAFFEADHVVIHPVFSSARERGSDEEAQNEGRRLAEAIPQACFAKNNLEAARLAYRMLRPGDLFISLGAGSNRETAERVLAMLAAETKD
jgi:UDP-N-acetylmuramate--alanine ligase